MASSISGLNAFSDPSSYWMDNGANTSAAVAAARAAAAKAKAAASRPVDNDAAVVTLTSEALATLGTKAPEKSIETVATEARATLNRLYEHAKVSGPYDASGKPTVDLSWLDRRSVFAISSNVGGGFSTQEQALATAELQRRFDAAMAPQAIAVDLTGDATLIYKAALEHLDSMSEEEKATDAWAATRKAVEQGLKAATADPSKMPQGIDGDPVAGFLDRLAAGATEDLTDFATVAEGARAALDAQKAAAEAQGRELVFDRRSRTGTMVDFSGFDSRSLSAIVLNEGDAFSAEEVRAADQEMKSRSRLALLNAVKLGQQTGDFRTLSLEIVGRYESMSEEERAAAGWSPEFRELAVQSYHTGSSILEALKGGAGGTSSGRMSLLDYIEPPSRGLSLTL